MEKISLARRLARFILNVSCEDLPDEVKNRAKNLLLDALGAAITSRDLPWHRMALESLRGSRGNATIFNYNLKTSAPDAAFVNATLACSTAHEDMLFKVHPGPVIIPTAIAIGEQENSSGAEVLAALVAGYDVLGRLYLGGPDINPGFRYSAIFGPFGAAAAAGKLLKLDENQLVNALGYATNFAAGLMEGLSAGTMEVNFHPGISARNGITSALLAKAGASAAEQAMEGKHGFYQTYTGTAGKIELAVSDIGKRYLIMEVQYKPYPACFWQQIPIELILRLVERHHINAEDVIGVVERLPYSEAISPGVDNAGPFKTNTQASLSAMFCGAAALLGKPVHSYKLYNYQYGDADIYSLGQKIKVIGEENRKAVRIEIKCRDGKEYAMEGSGEEVLIPDDERIRNKFVRNVSDTIGEKIANEIINVVSGLDRCANISELTEAMTIKN
jgi:2-methylcitrate dehydratase PrpD